MICVSSQCAYAEAISGTKHRPASKHISFDSSRRARIRIYHLRIDWLNLFEISAFLSAHAQWAIAVTAQAQERNCDISKRFQPIYAQLTDSCSTRRDESNDMCFVAVHAQKLSAGTKRRRASKHISFDSSRRVEPESINCA